MGVEHQMARMTARGAQITGEGFGGNSELSQTDIAMALAGLNGKAYWFMRLKFCADESMGKKLRHGMAFSMLGDAMLNGPDLTAKVAMGLATVALMQATTGPICERCNGTGTVTKANLSTDCKTCKGTGRLNMTQERAASLAGVSTPTYVKRYEHVVNDYVSKLEQYESRGLAHVRRKIYSGSEE